MNNNETIQSTILLLKNTRQESERLNIRIPIGFYVSIFDKLIHLLNIYKQNESFVYIFFESDLYFIKETVLYREEIAYDIIKEKIKIDLLTFYNILDNICNSLGIQDIKKIIKNNI